MGVSWTYQNTLEYLFAIITLADKKNISRSYCSLVLMCCWKTPKEELLFYFSSVVSTNKTKEELLFFSSNVLMKTIEAGAAAILFQCAVKKTEVGAAILFFQRADEFFFSRSCCSLVPMCCRKNPKAELPFYFSNVLKKWKRSCYFILPICWWKQ